MGLSNEDVQEMMLDIVYGPPLDKRTLGCGGASRIKPVRAMLVIVRGYDSTNAEVLTLQPESVGNAMLLIGMELGDWGNPHRVVRFDVYDGMGFVCRVNVANR